MKIGAVRDGLHALQKAGKLDKLLWKRPDARLPWSEWFWVNGALAIVALAIHLASMASRSSDGIDPQAADFVQAAVLLAVTGLAFVLAKLLVAPADRQRKRLMQNGVVVPTAIVQANPLWFRDDNTDWQPGSIVFSFDPRAADSPEELVAIAEALQPLKKQDRRTLPAGQAQIAWDLYHEMGPTPSLPVPPELARGLRDTWFASAMLAPAPIAYAECFLVLAIPGDPSVDSNSVLDRRLAGE